MPPRVIAQCFDGHVLCAECMHKHRNSNRGASSRQCPSCRNPLGQLTIRNRALETIIGCMKVQCPFRFGQAQCHAHLLRKDLDEHMHTARGAHIDLLKAAPADAIVPVVELLSGGLTAGAIAAAADAVGYLACIRPGPCTRGPNFRLAIIQAGAIAPLIELLDGTRGGEWGADAAANALRYIGRDDDTVPAIVEAGAITPLVRLLGRGGKATHTNHANHANGAAGGGAWALVHITRGTAAMRAAVADAGAIAPLVAMLGGGTQFSQPATLALLNLTRGTDAAKAAVADAGAIAPLVALLGGTIQIALNATRVLVNLGGCPRRVRMAMVGAGAVNQLLALLERGCGDAIIKMEVATLLQKLAGAIHESATEALRAA